MRLKSSDGPLSVHNVNNDILNSPKRINTVQNSNVTANYTANLTCDNTINSLKELKTEQIADLDALNNIHNAIDKVQWCNPAQNNHANNRNQLLNINNTLAASLRNSRHRTAPSICSESSPDDSLLDYEEARQSGSSADTSPQDEDRGFDLSDSESLSDEGNLSNRRAVLQRRGIVNPNYPGFQHLAHTLDYTIKVPSDTDDDYDCDSSVAKTQPADFNCLNNNNNNNGEENVDYKIDKIDSVNRLDSVENIQKVFYDKSVFNIECESLNLNLTDSENSSNSNPTSDEETTIQKLDQSFNIKTEESPSSIVGDFGKEVEQELGRLSCINSGSILDKAYFEQTFEPTWERAVVREIEEAIEKLTELLDLEPSAKKYNIEPNVEQPFELSPVDREASPVILEDAISVKAENMPLATEHLPIPELPIKMTDAFLSSAQENLPDTKDENKLLDSKMDIEKIEMKRNETRRDSNRELEEIECQIKKIKSDTKLSQSNAEEVEKFCKEDITKDYKEKDDDSSVPRKKEKIDSLRKRKDYNQQFGSLITFPRRDCGSRNRDGFSRKPTANSRDRKKASSEALGSFDVYNIETAMPKIDLDAIEQHLRAAREEERRRRTDREEIRRRLAMGSEDDYYGNRPGRKPSLQARLQSGMNLQICFMNEAVSDTESPSSDSECPLTNPKQSKTSPKNGNNLLFYEEKINQPTRPVTLSIGEPLLQPVNEPPIETDFFTRQARLQTEARMALAQAKEMARMQMEIEKQRLKKSPITEMVRHSLEKVGIPFPEEKRRLSRQILTEMNVAQLQVIVNDLHTQIETLNENLVKFLMNRDDLHMEQDSMLVDIEDLTRYLGAKEQILKDQSSNTPGINNNLTPPSPAPPSPLTALNKSVKPHLNRIASLVKK